VLCTKIACYTKSFLSRALHVLTCPYMLNMPLAFSPQPRAATTIYSQVCELQGIPMIPIFQDIVGHFLPHDLHDLSDLFSSKWWTLLSYDHMISAACRAILWSTTTFYPMIPWSRKSITATNPHYACPPGSPSCQFLLCQLLSHLYALDSPSFKFQIVPSRTHDLHKPLRAAEFTSACRILMSTLPNSHLRAGCQYLHCQIPRQPQFSSPYPPDEFSCLAWTVHRPAHVRQQSTLPIFLCRTYSCTNMRYRFIPLFAWLPAPLGTVLDSLLKYVPRAHLILLHLGFFLVI